MDDTGGTEKLRAQVGDRKVDLRSVQRELTYKAAETWRFGGAINRSLA